MTERCSARALDAADPLAPFRGRFLDPGPSVVAYLDGNSLGRPLAETGAHLWSFVAREWGDRLIRAWDESWMDFPFRLGDRLGEVCLGAAAGQCVVADSTSVLIYKLLRAALAAAPERDEIVMSRGDFPTDRYLAEGVAAETGARIVWLEPSMDGGVSVESVAKVVGERTAVVLLSHIAYRSGFLADAPAITAAAHATGARVIWDLCHSVGAVPMSLDAWEVDYAVGCTYKYLNGGPGAPAFAYVAARHQDSFQQPLSGWMGAADPFAMTSPYAPAEGMRRMLTGTPPILAMQPLVEMVAMIAEAGIDAIRAKSVMLTERAIELSDELLTPFGVRLSSPRDAAQRGGHVTIDHPAFEEVTLQLWEQGVIPDFRPPDGIRLGLSPLSTSFAELDLGIEAIREALAARA
ncbi:MAG: aminotransferase class V-fold PLP-dependent enzyme [Actinobacteria bacterium]|nr:aminotransferase class V-fold PLP-dependent enzyme [Actinomycetota bacterium]